MTERTTRPPPASRHRRCTASSTTRCCPAPASTPAAFWDGFDAIVHDLAPKNAALLAERDRLQAELDAWHRGQPGPDHATCAKYRAFLREDRLPGAGAGQGEGDDEERRRRAGAAGRPAAGGADHQRALCAERRQRALGLAVRRAVRHRRDARGPAAPRRAAATTRCAAPRSSSTRATCSTAAAPLKQGLAPRLHRLPRGRQRAGRDAEGRHAPSA